LREKMFVLKEARVRDLSEQLAKLKAEHEQALERLQKMETLEGMLASKNAELNRILVSKDKLVSMVKSLNTALYSCEEQLRSSQAARATMEENLSTWLPHFGKYTNHVALEALEAHAAAKRESFMDQEITVEQMLERAQAWRDQVRARAVQLSDWEHPPELPEQAPVSVEQLKLMLADIERMLGALVCLPTPEDKTSPRAKQRESAAEAEVQSLKALLAKEREDSQKETAKYQVLIAKLQQDLSEQKTNQVETVRQFEEMRKQKEAAEARAGTSA